MEKEVEGFLGRSKYERVEEFRGYRNGYGKERNIAIGYGQVNIKAPRVSDVPKEVSEDGYKSEILDAYQRSSKSLQKHFMNLYKEVLYHS